MAHANLPLLGVEQISLDGKAWTRYSISVWSDIL